MPVAPNLPVNIDTSYVDSATDASVKVHQQHHDLLHGIVNNIYLVNIGTTQTAAFTLAQSNSGELVPVSSASAVVVTVPSLQVGTSVELLRLGTGAVTLTVSGVTLVVPSGATAAPRVQGSTLSLVWLTTTSVLVGGDLT